MIGIQGQDSPMKPDLMTTADFDCHPRMISISMNSSYRWRETAAAEGDPLQWIDGLVLCTASHHHTLPIFHYGYWLCSDFGATPTEFLKPSTPRLNSLRFKTLTVLFSMMLGTFLFDVGAVVVSNIRLGLFRMMSPLSLLWFELIDSEESVIQPEKAFHRRGCYVGNGAEHSCVLKQHLAACWLMDLTD
jgi:hypothetical protein